MDKNRRTAKLSGRAKKRLLITATAAVLVLTALVLILQSTVSARFGKSGDTDVQTATVTVGSISTAVSGSGILADEGLEDVEIPAELEIETLYATAGDSVTEGELLATVNMGTVLSALSAKQEEIDELDDEIADAKDDTAGGRIYSTMPGRVKEIYAAAGDDVATVMYEHDALLLLSLDGYMAVDIESAAAPGTAVTVTASDGREYPGTVSAATGETATVLLSDDGPVNGDMVTVSGEDGSKLGEGELYIHEQMRITGYAGTVSYVYASLNGRAYSGSSLFSLSDSAYSANYDSLLRERAALEQELQSLIVIYREGAVYAPFTGTISSVTDGSGDTDETYAAGAAAASGDTAADTVITLCPDEQVTVSVSVDEADILSISLGQAATVTVNAIGDGEFEGTVTGIDRSGTSSNGVTTYTATVTIDKSGAMLAGMSATAVISIDGVDDALLIPEDALQRTSSTYYVYTSYDEQSGELGGMVEVTAGISNGSYVEISSGLSEGDTVYYTESQEDTFGFGGMSMGGGMPSGGNMGGGRPAGGGGMPGGFGG